MAVVKEKVCRGESQRSIALSGKLKKDGVEGVNSAASAAYLNLSVELSTDRMNSSQSDFTVSGVTYKAGDIEQTPVLLTVRYHLPVGLFSPYIGAGFGYYFNDYDKDNAFWNANVAVSLENSWGYHVNIGSEFFITKSRDIALNIDLKYVWNEADMEASVPGVKFAGTMDLDSYLVGLGIKYYF